MSEVYANGMNVACKAAAGKTTAAMPDVCLSPPSPPAGPVPIPYPNTAMASDTTGGTKTVQIEGQEVMMKDSSTFKTSSGNEAATKSLGMGVVTHQIQGETSFVAWSMDVKFEGANVPRHLDMTLHNEQCNPANTPPWPYMDSMAVSKDPCAKEKAKEAKACEDYKPKGTKDVCKEAGLTGGVVQSTKEAKAAGFKSSATWADSKAKKASGNKCASARRCMMTPYDAPKDGVKGCCPAQTADHIIPKSSFFKVSFDDGKKLPGWSKYDYKKAPCMCAEGGSNTAGSHGLRHAHHKSNGPGKGKMQSFDAEASLAAKGAADVFKSSGCSEACIKAQLENGHKDFGKGPVKHSPSGRKMSNEDISKRASALSPETVAP